jgi:hypothetical protein
MFDGSVIMVTEKDDIEKLLKNAWQTSEYVL